MPKATATIVVFRLANRYSQHGVIALFPEIPCDVFGWQNCQSYTHIGQHGSCDPDLLIRESRPATPEEYASLKTELEEYGDGDYSNLVVRQRISPQMRQNREKGWKDWQAGA